MSKGDKPRPMNVSQDEFEKRWEKAFGKNDDEETKEMIEKYINVVSDKVKKMPTIVDNDGNVRMPPEDALGRESKSGVTLLNDNSLNVELEKMKMEG